MCSTDSAVTARQNGRGTSTPMDGAAMEHYGRRSWTAATTAEEEVEGPGVHSGRRKCLD